MSPSIKKAVSSLPIVAVAATLLAGPGIAGAQYVEHWRQETHLGGGEYFEHSRLTGMTYNPVTDNVLVANRSLHTLANRTDVLVVSAEDGSDRVGMDTPDITWGLGGGELGLLKIAAVDRGHGDYSIYLCTATQDAKSDPSATGPGRHPFYLYRWEGSDGAEESTLGPPTLIYYNQTEDATQDRIGSGTPIGPPLPSVPALSFPVGYALHGVYDSVKEETSLFVSSSPDVVVMTISESMGAVTAVDRLGLTGPNGGGGSTFTGISVDSLGNIYTANRVYSATGQFVAQLDPDIVPLTSSQNRIMEFEGRRYLGYLWREVPNDAKSYVLRVVDLTSGPDNASLLSMTPSATKPSLNSSGFGDIALDTRRGRFIGLITNNMLVSFSQEEEPRVEVADFSATVNDSTGAVTVEWQTTLEIKNAGFNVYRLEGNDTTAGSRVNAALVPSIAGGGGAYSLEDTVTLAPGAIRSYWLENVDLNGNATAHAPVTVTREAANSAVGEWALY